VPKFAVQLVTWNGAKYIPHLFRSLREQTAQNWDLVVVDNGSTDETVELLKRELEFLSQFRTKLRKELRHWFIRNAENRGFAGGHNQAFEAASCKLQAASPPEYVQLLNQDIVLAPDYLERVLAAMEAMPDAGAMQGALLRWDFSRAGEADGGRTDTVDTLGLRVLRSRRVVELGTGEAFDSSLGDARDCFAPTRSGLAMTNEREVFGVSGALPIYRGAALLDVALRKSEVRSQKSEAEVFDEDFFSYKEDVDLAFRLRSRGWRSFIVPNARAWHDRTAAGPRALSDFAAADSRRAKSAFVRYHSYKNHLAMLAENEHAANFARDWPRIFWYEFKKFAYLLAFDRATLRALREVWRQRHAIRRKRAHVMARATATPAELRKWFV